MSLVPASAASAITTAYLAIANLDTDGSALDTPLVPSDFVQAFADGYDTYAKAGVVPGAANAGGTKSLLTAVLSAQAVPATATFVTTLAQALADYWATVAVTPGDPAHGGTSVATVTNNASTLVSAFAAAITASITTSESSPYFETFVVNIEEVVKTIVWTVTELVGAPPVPTAFAEAIT